MMSVRAAKVCIQCVRRPVQRTLNRLFSRKYLLYTNTGISVIMSGLGDGLQQNYQILHKEISSWDRRRSRDVAITGLLIGPFCHFWYIFLDWWLPGKTFKVVTKKLIVDQLICSPVAITSFLAVTSYLEGKRGKELKQELLKKGKTLYAAEWIVWPPAQIINFCFLPTRYRVLFDNCVSFGFDWYFSYVKYGKGSDTLETEEISEQREKEALVDKAADLRLYASHVPFLHIQAADIVQTKIQQIPWDQWNEGFGDLHSVTDKHTASTNSVHEDTADVKNKKVSE